MADGDRWFNWVTLPKLLKEEEEQEEGGGGVCVCVIGGGGIMVTMLRTMCASFLNNLGGNLAYLALRACIFEYFHLVELVSWANWCRGAVL